MFKKDDSYKSKTDSRFFFKFGNRTILQLWRKSPKSDQKKKKDLQLTFKLDADDIFFVNGSENLEMLEIFLIIVFILNFSFN